MLYKEGKTGCILGHHPLLSIVEVLSKTSYRADIQEVDKEFLILERGEQLLVDPKNLGGVQKIIVLKGECQKQELIQEVSQMLVEICAERSIEKLLFTVSVYGKYKRVQKELLLGIKKRLREHIKGKVRFAHKSLMKNVATAVLHTEHIIEQGVDIVICEKNGKYYYGYSRWVQDIDFYTKRDMERPHRDLKNGILPPKLAQTMLNLVPKERQTCIWDPFCGSGGVLLEALLAGHDVIGSDFNEEMISQAQENIEWLQQQEEYNEGGNYELFVQDATQIKKVPTLKGEQPTAIVTEGFLGENFVQSPNEIQIRDVQQQLLKMYRAFFKTLEVAPSGLGMVITLPFHITRNGKYHRFTQLFEVVKNAGWSVVPLLADVKGSVGDRNILRSYTKQGTVLYTRGKQYVGREICHFSKN